MATVDGMQECSGRGGKRPLDDGEKDGTGWAGFAFQRSGCQSPSSEVTVYRRKMTDRQGTKGQRDDVLAIDAGNPNGIQGVILCLHSSIMYSFKGSSLFS